MSNEQTKQELIQQVRDLLLKVDALEKETSAEHVARIAAEAEGERQARLTAVTLHELRQPLTAIIGFATTLLATDVLYSEDEQHDILLIITHEAERMQRLLEDFVELARSALARTKLNLGPVPVEDIIEVARPQLRTLAKAHKLQIELPPELPPVEADRERVAQVVVNLVQNSVHYAPPKTPIIIRAQPAEEVVQVEVIDHGPGIPPDARTSIFEPFRQVDDGSASRPGMGLGLAISKAIVEAHRGRIWADEYEGPGARLCFTLPVHQSTIQ